jgi:RHS repeat-associated protein
MYSGAGTTTPQWLHADPIGSTIAWSDATGAALGTRAYDPYGQPSVWSGPRYAYTGQLMIAEGRFYDYKARAYFPGLGRFLQTDPAGYASDVNPYAYAGNDPLDFTDPSGMIECIICNKRVVAQDYDPGSAFSADVSEIDLSPPVCGAWQVLTPNAFGGDSCVDLNLPQGNGPGGAPNGGGGAGGGGSRSKGNNHQQQDCQNGFEQLSQDLEKAADEQTQLSLGLGAGGIVVAGAGGLGLNPGADTVAGVMELGAGFFGGTSTVTSLAAAGLHGAATGNWQRLAFEAEIVAITPTAAFNLNLTKKALLAIGGTKVAKLLADQSTGALVNAAAPAGNCPTK